MQIGNVLRLTAFQVQQVRKLLTTLLIIKSECRCSVEDIIGPGEVGETYFILSRESGC